MNLQTDNQTVVEVRYQYSYKTRERIHTLRKEQWTIIITAILVGLTLNLISDFIGSFFDNTIEFVTFAYRGIVAVVAGVATFIIMICLVIRDSGDLCRRERQLRMSFFFDPASGKPYAMIDYIPTARLATEFEKSPDKQKENLTQLVKDAIAKKEIANLVPFLELLTIYEITHRQVPIPGKSELFPIKDKIRLRTPSVGRNLLAYGFKIPGEFSLDYTQREKGGRIDITWSKGT